MKRIKQISFVALAVAYLTAPLTVLAQKDEKDKVKEKKETETFIITKKNSDEKTVIEIIGDKITVNGKPVDEKSDGDVTVQRHKIKDTWAFSGPDGFGSWGDNYSMHLSPSVANRAVLGVISEKTEKGIEIQTITKGGGAEKAGLKVGDIIKKIDDKKIEDSDDLSKTIRTYKPGDKVTVTYLREGKESKVTAELGKYKITTTITGQRYNSPNLQSIPRISQGYAFNWSGGSSKLGIAVQDTEDGKGVKVLEVDEDGNAGKAGIKEDDIITEVDGKAVNGADEIAKIVKDSKDKVSVKMKLVRNGKTETLDVKIPRRLKTADL